MLRSIASAVVALNLASKAGTAWSQCLRCMCHALDKLGLAWHAAGGRPCKLDSLLSLLMFAESLWLFPLGNHHKQPRMCAQLTKPELDTTWAPGAV